MFLDELRDDEAGGGYGGAIGVRPAWRGKGVAKALLLRTFTELWRRGTIRAALDVDSQDTTGMDVEACGVAFGKVCE